MKKHNKIYTKSYFKKRLKESGFSIKDPQIQYDALDNRYWTLIVEDNGGIKKNILVTCFRKSFDNFWFSLHTEHCSNFKIYTKSMQIIVEHLENLFNENQTSH